MSTVQRGSKMLADPLQQRLAAPFDVSEVKWKPQTVSGNRALMVAFVDARLIMDRLDQVVGMQNWECSYQVLACGSVQATLRIRFTSEWITKSDVGSPSEQPDEGDRMKAAFSDALKRAAVHFGIGRYLYRLPQQWMDYDPKTRKAVGTPNLPEWAMPSKKPTNGVELKSRLAAWDVRLAKEKKCAPGAVVAHIEEAGRRHRLPADIAEWGEAGIELAIAEGLAFEARLKMPGADPADKPAILPMENSRR